MRKYLASLPDRSDKHKKRFAFLTSLGITLFIFSVWSLVNFGLPGDAPILAQEYKADTNTAYYEEPVPLEGLGNGVANAFGAIKNSFNALMRTNFDGVEDGLRSIDTTSEYEELRQRALQ